MAFISNIFHYNNISLLKGTFVDKQQHKKQKLLYPYLLALHNSVELVDSISAYATPFSYNSEITSLIQRIFYLFTLCK